MSKPITVTVSECDRAETVELVETALNEAGILAEVQ